MASIGHSMRNPHPHSADRVQCTATGECPFDVTITSPQVGLSALDSLKGRAHALIARSLEPDFLAQTKRLRSVWRGNRVHTRHPRRQDTDEPR